MAQPSRVEFVQLTGQPRALAGQDAFSFVPDKRFQLLAYLAYNGGWIGRERLAFLFWPDTDVANSKQNLRGLLQRLRSVPWAAEVEVTPHHLRWAPETDVRKYRDALAQGLDDAALEAYRGPLLTGLESDDDGEFSEWLEIERQRLYGDWRAAVLRRMRELPPAESRGVEGLLRRLLEADPLDEEAVRAYLNAAARSGQVGDARSAYRNFTAFLRSEMGLEPTSETVAAYEQVLRVEALGLERKPGGVAAVTTGQPIAASSSAAQGDRGGSHQLPTVSTSFVGRDSELAEVVGRIRDPDCRVLTLLGAGGVGKTRLALRAGNALRSEFDAVTFVALDSVATAEQVPTALAGALGVQLVAGEEPLGQVARSLRSGRFLLLLDNFEHVLDAAPVVNVLVEAGIGVKLLVSSRERLGLESEWLIPLEGLDYPSQPVGVGELAAYPAVRLFLERGTRVNPGFTLGPGDEGAMLELCRQLDGLPLAIELAAAWVRALPLKAIADGLKGNLDLLESSTRDATPRHRSIRATFEQSWSILSPAEQGVLRRLSVFRAAVSPTAAAFVAGASNVLLAALVDKSLLRLRGDGRYDRHPLLLEFAREKLDAVPDERRASIERHAAYFLRFLRERTDYARGPRPSDALAQIDTEITEIIAAAHRARQLGNNEELVGLMQLLAIDTGYFLARGFGPDTLELLEAAALAAAGAGWLEAAHGLRGRFADAFGVHRGDAARAHVEYGTAAELARACGNQSREAVYLSMCGVMRNRLDPKAADSELDAAFELVVSSGDDLCVSTVLEHRAFILAENGSFEAAANLYRRSLEAVERLEAAQAAEPYELHRRRFYALLNLGSIEQTQQRFEEALGVRSQALEIAEASGNPIWVSHALQELGELHGVLGNHDQAKAHLTRALKLYQENNVSAYSDRILDFMRSHGYLPLSDELTPYPSSPIGN